MKNDIIQEYKKNLNMYHKYGETLKNLLSNIVSQEGIHSISYRVKDIKSLKNKIEMKDKYKSINDITDIVGIRIITFLPEQVDKIAEILRKDFIEDDTNSIDKRIHEEDRFGYMSLHLIFEINSSRSKLKEYTMFKNIKFEVQIRTILQHAWAEIEHDIGYKSSIEIPSEFKRRFFRLASILELADEEFQHIVDNIEEYKLDTKKKLENQERSIELNKDSLFEYITNSDTLERIRDEVAKALGDKTHVGNVARPGMVSRLSQLGYKYINEIDNDIKEYKNQIINFAIEVMKAYRKDKGHVNGRWGLNTGVLYLAYYKVMITEDEEAIISYLQKHIDDSLSFYDKLEKAYHVLKSSQ